MEDKLEKLKKFSDFTDNPELAIFEELLKTNEKLEEISSKEMPEMPEFPEIPEPKEVIFPDVQKVEVINQQEPVINVNVPDVIVPEIKLPELPEFPEIPTPIVNIDTKGLDQGLKDINETLKDVPTVENPMPVVLVWKDETYKAEGGKETKVVGGFGGGAQLIAIEENTAKLATDYAIVLDDVTTTNVTYVGKAPIGSATSSAVWQIKRLDESGTPNTLVIKYADGDALYNNVWDNRSALTYN